MSNSNPIPDILDQIPNFVCRFKNDIQNANDPQGHGEEPNHRVLLLLQQARFSVLFL